MEGQTHQGASSTAVHGVRSAGRTRMDHVLSHLAGLGVVCGLLFGVAAGRSMGFPDCVVAIDAAADLMGEEVLQAETENKKELNAKLMETEQVIAGPAAGRRACRAGGA